MSKIGVELRIDVSKIDKSKLYKGEKGTYLTMTAFIDSANPDQYGNNGMITQKVTKEEQDSGVKGAILGNSKVFWSEQGQTQQGGFNQQPPQGFNQAPQQGYKSQQQQDGEFDDVPF